MSKALKLRIYRAITTTLQSCRSKDPSNLPRNPIPSSSKSHQQQHYTFQTQPKYHVITATPAPPKSKRHRRRTRKRPANRLQRRTRLSTTSSAESSWPRSFTSEEESSTSLHRHHGQEEIMDRLVCSSTNDEGGHVPRQRRRRKAGRGSPEAMPARLSVFKKLIPCTVDGKVKESFAVVKRSRDPYEDFKISMMDMVLEKNMFDERELQQLLQCFLSLNSTRYHEIIVRAFYDICEAVFETAM